MAHNPRTDLIWVVAACRFFEAIAIAMLIPVLPIFLSTLAPEVELFGLLDRLAESSAEAKTAVLFSATGFAMALVQIFSARLSDAVDRRKVFVLVGMLAGSACSLALIFIDSYGQLLAVRVAQGLALGITFPPLMAIVARYAPVGRGGSTLGIYTTIRLIGFASGPLVGGFVSELGGYTAVFTTSFTLLVLSIGLVAWFVPDPRETTTERTKTSKRPPLAAISWKFRLLGSAVFLMMVGVSAIITLFPTYKSEYGATQEELGWIFSAFLGARFLLQYPLGRLGDRFDKKLLLLSSLLLFCPVVTLQGFIRDLDDLLILRVILGVAVAAISSSVSGIAAERSEPGNRARVMGTNTFSFSLGVAVGPLLTGVLTDARVAFAIPGSLVLVTALLIATQLESDRAFAENKIEDPDLEGRVVPVESG